MIGLAISDWPAAAVWIAGIAFLTIVISVLIWQIFATGRGAIASEGGKQYKQLADELAQMQRETTAELQKANEALAQLRGQTQELERGLKELDRILKAVEKACCADAQPPAPRPGRPGCGGILLPRGGRTEPGQAYSQ
jgi:Tfp pilus assembly protein PilO